MAVLPDAWLRLLNVLIDAPLAWRSPAEIASALDRNEGETTDLLCDLDVAGWLVVWEAGSGLLVTLSALAAERLEVRLVEMGPGETPRWARAGDPDPPALRSKHVCLSERAASLEFIADLGLTPDLAAERGERAEKHARSYHDAPARPNRRDEPPRPTVLLGLSLTPWPGPCPPFDTACPACGDCTLAPHMYCLYCDRWGFDTLVAPVVVAPHAPARSRQGRSRPEPARLVDERVEADRLRERRKSKRRLRHQAKIDAERKRKLNPQAPPSVQKVQPRTTPVPLYSPPPGKISDKAER